MTPAARYAAAIEVLDQVIAGGSAEQALKQWGRGHRFAGSKDRAAIRDHVFNVLRAKRSLGDGDGRALILALLRRDGIDPGTVFGADAYAPLALTAQESGKAQADEGLSLAAACDVPEWLWDQWQSSLGRDAAAVARAQQHRAPVFLRVNLQRTTRDKAIASLAGDNITAIAHGNVNTALQVIENERRIKLSAAYLSGEIELQDASSQAAVLALKIPPKARVLDYCAGGGGKSLALADIHSAIVTAHDIAVQRMIDLPVRAARANVHVDVATTKALSTLAPFDLVLCDAPCSGSGTWRRTPESKWALTLDKLKEYNAMQRDVLVNGARYVAAGGTLAYATCSVLRAENEAVVDHFLTLHPDWDLQSQFKRIPSETGDGFFLAALKRHV